MAQSGLRPAPPATLPPPVRILEMTQPCLIELQQQKEELTTTITRLQGELATAQQTPAEVQQEIFVRDTQENVALDRLHNEDALHENGDGGEEAVGDPEQEEQEVGSDAELSASTVSEYDDNGDDDEALWEDSLGRYNRRIYRRLLHSPAMANIAWCGSLMSQEYGCGFFAYSWKLPDCNGTFYLQLRLGAFLLTVGAFLLTVRKCL